MHENKATGNPQTGDNIEVYILEILLSTMILTSGLYLRKNIFIK